MAEENVTPDLYRDMVSALKGRYPTRESSLGKEDWIMIEEVRVGTGFRGDNEQRIDVWIMQAVGGNAKVAIEIKVSRQDFLREMAKPLKRRPGMRLSNLFYFYAPRGIILPTEVPPECGLLEYDSEDSDPNATRFSRRFAIKETIRAPWRDAFPPTWSFVASLHRNILREAEVKCDKMREEMLRHFQARRPADSALLDEAHGKTTAG